MTGRAGRPEGGGLGGPQKDHHEVGRSTREHIADRLPAARAVAYAPCGRRSQWALIVPVCPACGGMHAHRGLDVHGTVKSGSCGHPYRVVVEKIGAEGSAAA